MSEGKATTFEEAWTWAEPLLKSKLQSIANGEKELSTGVSFDFITSNGELRMFLLEIKLAEYLENNPKGNQIDYIDYTPDGAMNLRKK